jgi:IclR family transcriptional regulator, acetate operon repressor
MSSSHIGGFSLLSETVAELREGSTRADGAWQGVRPSAMIAVPLFGNAMRPIELALQVIERVAELQPIGTSDLARRMELPKATVHRLLLALEKSGWLEREEDSRALWCVSLKPIAVAGRAIERKRGLRMAALPIMDELRRSTDETLHLGLLDGDGMVLMERFDGGRSIHAFLPVGTHWLLHRSSAGKAVLAHLPKARQEAYMQVPRYRRPTDELLTPEELSAELDLIRERGFAISLGLQPPHSSSVGAAIFDKHGLPFAGLSVTGAADRLKAEQCLALAPLVVAAARRISMGMSMA